MAAENKTYSLIGKISDKYNGKKIYINELNQDRNNFINLDSAVVNNGQFVFVRPIDNSASNIRFVTVETSPELVPIMFVPETGQIKVAWEENKFKVGGTPKNDDLQEFLETQDSLQTKIQDIINYYKGLDQTSENYKKRVKLMEPLIDTLAQSRYNYAMNNIQSDLGEFIALTSFEMLPPERILELVKATRPEFKNSALGKEVVQYYEAQLSKTPGEYFKDLELTYQNGENVKLSDYAGKGKVVLVDFWASWCGPCIKEMPVFVDIYEKYKDKGFEIVGVSFDENQESWIKATEKLNITWPQMSDLKGWKSQATTVYGINSIPFTLLIDKEGKIISSNLRGQQLIDKLQELLD